MDGPLQIMARGDCEAFIRQFLKYNVSNRDKGNYLLLKTEELDIDLYMEVNPLDSIPVLVQTQIPPPE